MNDYRGLVEALSSQLEDGEQVQRLAAYTELIETWAPTHNLVSFASREELLHRHILEPLAFSKTLRKQGRLLDVGSGAGLPGIPLLISQPGWSGVLLEPRQKRWAFLRLVIRELGLQAEVIASRYEEYRNEGDFDLVTARAVGGYSELASWCRSRLTEGGRLVLWTSEQQALELQHLPGWRVLSCPAASLDRGLVLQLEPCFT